VAPRVCRRCDHPPRGEGDGRNAVLRPRLPRLPCAKACRSWRARRRRSACAGCAAIAGGWRDAEFSAQWDDRPTRPGVRPSCRRGDSWRWRGWRPPFANATALTPVTEWTDGQLMFQLRSGGGGQRAPELVERSLARRGWPPEPLKPIKPPGPHPEHGDDGVFVAEIWGMGVRVSSLSSPLKTPGRGVVHARLASRPTRARPTGGSAGRI